MASLLPTKLTFLAPNPTRSTHFRHPRQTLHLTHAKFNLSELLGGRGLCNGEKGVEQELTKQPKTQPPPPPQPSQSSSSSEDEPAGFDKELFGLTGGFPGGEKGLINFVEKNPPPAKSTTAPAPASSAGVGIVKKVKAPELPLLLPGMIVMVKSERNPFHLYCGIVQRITDGKAGVLFEGGNWDRLVTFRLEELERREKGPPMVNPLSAIFEGSVEQ